MLLYTKRTTPRVQYIADFFGSQMTGNTFELTNEPDYFQKATCAKINYSDERLTTDEFWIKPHKLLFENIITEQPIKCFEFNHQKAFFKTEGDFSFDVFAASFYLISRYEEYLPHQKDMFGRYAHSNSLAFKEGFLDQPLVNIWLYHFSEEIKKKFPFFNNKFSEFTFLPTYDIDIAWSYKHKGFWRNAGGLLSSVIKGDFVHAWDRICVLSGKRKDPFDTYAWLHHLHEQYRLKPYYFFLLALQNSKYDKNILPGKKELANLISDHLIRYPVGIHPSWQSGDLPLQLEKEINTLSIITGNRVLSSRQHYIRMTLPVTLQRLIEAGIRFDFSMGYGSINGFRASVATPYYWYDLEQEKQTELMLFPFCFMEANSYYEQKFSPKQALEEMRHYYYTIKSINGTYIMIWHNQFFGSDSIFAGWKEVYEQFIKEISKETS